ncbi:MAG: hypothetical protein J2P41_06365 [Blastocatellia bacterium]|nr:hypothetical protein [Blastocatellia bacterium]
MGRSFEWPGRGLLRGYRCPVLACLIFTLIFISCVNGSAQSDQVVAREQKAFFEAWLRRELHGDELRQVTDEFIAYFTKQGKDRAGIHEATKQFLEYAKILRQQDGAPLALNLRHSLLEANYFNPNLQNTTELRLLTEPDPVRVADPGGKHLMTEKDVVALANLMAFSNSEAEPRPRDFARRQIESLIAELDRSFGNHPNASLIPRFYRETAALWAGILREWPTLNATERGQARAYAAKGCMAPIDEFRLYGRLLDLNEYDAFGHWQSDISEGYLHIWLLQMRLTSLQNALFGSR